MNDQIRALEQEIDGLNKKLLELRREAEGSKKVQDYTFQSLTGDVTLADLFGDREILFALHNMGQGCRYCTLWADGINGFLPHLEDKFAFVLLSKDSPEDQRRFANSRGWRFRMASHGGGPYITEQNVEPGETGTPGMVCYEKKDGVITRRNSTGFGPGDQFCALWPILSLAGLSWDDVTPQYSYWKRPEAAAMDDGGQNLQ